MAELPLLMAISATVHGEPGTSTNSSLPHEAADSTTIANYWLNWRFLLCAIGILFSVVIAAKLIWKYEGGFDRRKDPAELGEENADCRKKKETIVMLWSHELWRPCLGKIHPVWLLVFRLSAFAVLLELLVLRIVLDGGSIFYYYTELTFVLVTIYFGLASLFSIHGCRHYDNNNKVGNKDNIGREEDATRELAGFWGHALLVIYQTSAGAVMLTDCVFWFIIAPFLKIKHYPLDLLMIGMHTTNVVFLLCDTALNSLHFQWFRIAYFLLWTGTYVIFQWLLHACTSIWWPYPFLDLSSNLAPLWYLLVTLMHIPCFAVFPIIGRAKLFLLSRWFPDDVRK